MSQQKLKNNVNGNKTHESKGKSHKKNYDQKIFRDWCKSCGLCEAFCPKSVFGRDDMGNPVIERSDDCVGCRFCEQHCPDFAITITERKVNDKGGQA